MAEPTPFPKGGRRGRRAVDDAPVVPPAPEPADDGDRRGGGRDGGDMPSNCPVRPLGKVGQLCCFLDADAHYVELPAQQLGRLQLMSLFGKSERWLYDNAPWYGKEGLDPDKFRAEKVQRWLIYALSEAGYWNPLEKVRGAGAWRGDDNELITHCGNEVLIGNKWHPPGRYGRFVYPADDPTPRPSEIYVPGGKSGPAQTLLDMLGSWNWQRPDVDPVLLLGWIMMSFAGAAPRWRTPGWITGDSATGKSTLHELIKLVFGDGGLLTANDASQAGITQLVKHSSLPVALDELEPSSDPRKVQAVVNLMRLATTGGQMLRGGADHKGHQFTLRMGILASSILISALPRQDQNRIAKWELKPLKGATPPKMVPRMLNALGAALRRRLIDQWPRFDETLEAYRAVIGQALGRDDAGRVADQYGTLLAFYDLAIADDLPSHAAIEGWAERILPTLEAARSEDIADHDRMLAHLLTYTIDPWRNGTRKTLADWLRDARAELARNDDKMSAKAVESYGIKVVREPVPAVVGGSAGERWWLYIANQHTGLRQIFADTHWQSPPDATGVWVQSARRYPGAEIAPAVARIGGLPMRCTRLPFDQVLPQEAA